MLWKQILALAQEPIGNSELTNETHLVCYQGASTLKNQWYSIWNASYPFWKLSLENTLPFFASTSLSSFLKTFSLIQFYWKLERRQNTFCIDRHAALFILKPILFWMSSEIPKTPAICSFGNLYATRTPPRFLNRGTKTMHGWRASTCESNVWIVVKAGDVYQWSVSCPRPLYILFCYSILFKSMFNSWFREIASDLAIVLFVNHKFTKITKNQSF